MENQKKKKKRLTLISLMVILSLMLGGFDKVGWLNPYLKKSALHLFLIVGFFH